MTAGAGGFLTLDDAPGNALAEAAVLGQARAAREHACRLYEGSGGEPRRERDAYIYMRTAADCGGPVAAMYVSASLRAGRGAAKSSDLANSFLRKAAKYLWRNSGHATLNEAVQSFGNGAPPDFVWRSETDALAP